MLKITRLTDYATAILGYMAREADGIFSASDLALRLNIGGPTVSKILKILAKNGILLSSRGAEGGYRLARLPQDIHLGDILSAMEGGPVALTQCASHAPLGHCEQASHCGVKTHWQYINDAIFDALSKVTLLDLQNPPQLAGFKLRLVEELRSEV